MTAGKLPTIRAIQALRGIAALLVVIYHAGVEFEDQLLGFPVTPGRFGVDIFFVVSAFVMIATTEHSKASPFGFFKRRVLRVAPLYWIVTCLAAALLVIDPEALRHTAVTGASFLKSLAFIPHENPGNPGVATPTYLIGWTLNFEMYFYALLALALAISHERRAVIVGAVVVALVVLRNLGLVSGWVILDFFGSEIALEFVFGMVLAHFWLQGRLPLAPPLWAALALALGLAAPFVEAALGLGFNPFLVYAPSAVICVWAALSLEPVMTGRWSKPLMTLGDASYSLYLVHIFVILLLVAALALVGLTPTSPLASFSFIALACVASIAVALLTFRMIERPIMDAARRRAGRA